MQLDNLVMPWKSGLFQIVSLLDMLKICPEDFHILMRELEALSNDGELFEISRIRETIDKASDYCNLVDLNASLAIINQLYEIIKPPEDFFADEIPINLGESIRMLHAIIKDELSERLFLFVPQDDAQWFEKEDGFGVEVSEAFPSAFEDIKEAGTCYATGSYTACVFHLMRIAEIGLRVLIWDRGIKFKKATPIELKEFRELFEGLERAEKDISGYAKTMARDAQLAFYHGAMVQLRAFMNLYRHRTMHAREFYSKYRAKEAMENVSKFMKILASKISETKRTPLVWKKG